MGFPLIFEGDADYVQPDQPPALPYVAVPVFVAQCAYPDATVLLNGDGQLVQADGDVDPKPDYDPTDWTPITETDAGLIPITPQEFT